MEERVPIWIPVAPVRAYIILMALVMTIGVLLPSAIQSQSVSAGSCASEQPAGTMQPDVSVRLDATLQPDENEMAYLNQAPHSTNSTAVLAKQSYYVDGSVSHSGNGNAGSPFKTIQEGVDAAQPGDIVWVAAGVYDRMIQTVRDGEKGRPITIHSNPPVQPPFGAEPGWVPENESQRVWIRREGRGIDINHSHFIFDGINIDGLWNGNAFIDKDGLVRDTTMDSQWVSGTNGLVRVAPDAESIVLRNIEVKNNQRHMLTIYGRSVVVDNARIHHSIARVRNTPAPEPGIISGDDYFRDAHGIEASNSFGLRVINTYIGYVSGDCVQLGRSVWGDFLVENSHFEIAPLDEPVLGLSVGSWFGEDHYDSKTIDRGGDGVTFNKGVTFRNSTFNGTRYSRYEHGAVLNSKEGVEDIVFENNFVYDNRITLRLRRPTRGYTIRNNVFYDNDTAVWFEGKGLIGRIGSRYESSYIHEVKVLNNTFYDNEVAISETGGGGDAAIIAANIFAGGPNIFELDGPSNYWRHNLYFQTSSEQMKLSGDSIIVADPEFADSRNRDFRLNPDSPALLLGIGARPEIK